MNMGPEDRFTDRLSEYLDGELEARERVELERHLETCGACRTTLDELRSVVAHASALEDTGPDTELWSGVAARIGAPAAVKPPVGTFRSAIGKRITFTLPQLAAAALALMVLSGGLVWRARSGDPRADFQPVSASDANPSAAAGLPLEDEAARVLDTHLRAIDAAIAEANAALDGHPGEEYLAGHVARLKSQRVALLRETADQHSAGR
jgi:anti-sigma factor RsiW